MILNGLPNSEIRKYIQEFAPTTGLQARWLERFIFDNVPPKTILLDDRPFLSQNKMNGYVKAFQRYVNEFWKFVERSKDETLQSND